MSALRLVSDCVSHCFGALLCAILYTLTVVAFLVFAPVLVLLALWHGAIRNNGRDEEATP